MPSTHSPGTGPFFPASITNPFHHACPFLVWFSPSRICSLALSMAETFPVIFPVPVVGIEGRADPIRCPLALTQLHKNPEVT